MESSVEDMRATMLEWADAQESLSVEITDQFIASAEVSAPVSMPAQASSSLSEASGSAHLLRINSESELPVS